MQKKYPLYGESFDIASIRLRDSKIHGLSFLLEFNDLKTGEIYLGI